MRTIAITGSASGIGAATKQALEAEGARVIGVDLAKADIEADLSQPDGRAQAIAQLRAACDGRLDGLVTCAGISGTRFRGSQITSVNYFGTVDLLEGLRPALAQGEAASAVAIASNSTTTMPNIPDDLVEACLSGDVAKSSELADAQPFFAYAAAKTALARWVRRNAVGDDWAGAGITLNAVAPGRTRTAMDDGTLKDEILGPHVEAFPIPIGRPGRAEEIGDFVAFLLGPKGRFFCGSMLYIDGGTDALMRADDWPVSLRS